MYMRMKCFEESDFKNAKGCKINKAYSRIAIYKSLLTSINS